MTDKKYKLLILDYGGVYSFEYDITNFDKIMLHSFGKVPNQKEKEEIAIQSRAFAANSITTNQYVTAVAEILGTSELPKIKDFEDTTISMTHPPSTAMQRLVSIVRNSGVEVSLLSDMYEFEVIKTRLSKRYEGFDYVSFSAEAKMTKNNPEFFRKTLHYFNVPAEQTLFVDDIKAHTETAESIGISVLYADKKIFHNVEQLVQKIRELFGI